MHYLMDRVNLQFLLQCPVTGDQTAQLSYLSICAVNPENSLRLNAG